MAVVNFKYGTKAKLDESPIVDGTIYVCLDNNYMYADIDGERKILGGIDSLGNAAYQTIEEQIEETSPDENVPNVAAMKDFLYGQGVVPQIAVSSTQPTNGYAKIWIEV